MTIPKEVTLQSLLEDYDSTIPDHLVIGEEGKNLKVKGTWWTVVTAKAGNLLDQGQALSDQQRQAAEEIIKKADEVFSRKDLYDPEQGFYRARVTSEDIGFVDQRIKIILNRK